MDDRHPSRHEVWVTGVAELAKDGLPGDPLTANAMALEAAAEDATVGLDEIDALFVYDSFTQPHPMQATKVAEYLGVQPQYAVNICSGGATPLTGVALGAGLLRSGVCRHIAVMHSDMRSSAGGKSNSMLKLMPNIAGNAEYEVPFGPLVPTLYSFLASWMLTEWDVDRRHLAAVAVAARQWASLNPNAIKRTPLTIDEVLQAPRVAGPLGRYDCCLITDFSGAVVVSAESSGPRAVRVAGLAGAAVNDEILQMPADPLASTRACSDRLYRDAGLAPADVDLAYPYDSFTSSTALQLVAYGLDQGAGFAHLIDEVGIGPGGGMPVNTHGGMLAALTGGLFQAVEAVRQLRGEAGERQVDGARNALVTNVGGVFGHHSAAIFQRLEE
jgi:acetyl-CoA acetyltransferase